MWGIDDIAVVRQTGDSTWRLRVTVESYLYYYRVQGTGYGAQGTEHEDTGLRVTYIRAESQGDSCSPSTSGEAYTNNTSPILPLLGVIQLHRVVRMTDIPVDRGGEVPGSRGR